MGRDGPLIFFTEQSLLRPNIRISPRDLAFSRYFTCPACRMSKHPLVKTTLFPLARSPEASALTLEKATIFFSVIGTMPLLPPGRVYVPPLHGIPGSLEGIWRGLL